MVVGQEHHLHQDERRERRKRDGDERDESEQEGVETRALAFHADPVALALRLVRQRRAQLLVEFGRRVREQDKHHQEIEMEYEIKQRGNDIKRQQRDLDVEDRQGLRLAQQQVLVGRRQRGDGEIKRQAEEREPQSLEPLGRAVQRSEQCVEVLSVGPGCKRLVARNRNGQRLDVPCVRPGHAPSLAPFSICI